jgi:hypothetical protein
MVAGDYIVAAPRNLLAGGSRIVAALPAPGVGWVWNGRDLFATRGDGRALFKDVDGNPY